MTPEEIGNAIRAFRSKTCPACGGEKAQRNDTFCVACTALLPEKMRDAVAERGTYLETFRPAVEHLRGVQDTQGAARE